MLSLLLGLLSGASPVCFARRNLMSKLNDSAAQTIPRAIKRKNVSVKNKPSAKKIEETPSYPPVRGRILSCLTPSLTGRDGVGLLFIIVGERELSTPFLLNAAVGLLNKVNVVRFYYACSCVSNKLGVTLQIVLETLVKTNKIITG